MSVRYKVRFSSERRHYVEIEARFPVVEGQTELEVFLPVWTPGSYMVREYSRHLEGLTANVLVEKTRKNRWSLRWIEEIREVVLCYSLYCHDLTV